MADRVQVQSETTTSVGVGPGLVRPLALQHSGLADEFFHRFGRMHPGGIQQAFSDFAHARDLSRDDAEQLRTRLHQVYGLTGIATRVW